MTRVNPATSTFSEAADDFGLAPRHPYHTTFPEEPTNVQQNYFPLVRNDALGTFPLSVSLHHAEVVSIPSVILSDPESHSPEDPPEISILSLSDYLNFALGESIAHDPSSTSSFTDGGHHLCDILRADPVHPHQVDETTPETLPIPDSSSLPYSVPPATPHLQNLPESTNASPGSTSELELALIQAFGHPASMLSILPDAGEATSTVVVLPLPYPPASDIPVHPSNTIYICQCMIDGSPCNAILGGSVRSVRDHLKRNHAFHGDGKEAIGCTWAGCQDTLQRENIPRHIVSRHLRVKVRCAGCGLPLSRSDVQYTHARACRARRTTA